MDSCTESGMVDNGTEWGSVDSGTEWGTVDRERCWQLCTASSVHEVSTVGVVLSCIVLIAVCIVGLKDRHIVSLLQGKQIPVSYFSKLMFFMFFDLYIWLNKEHNFRKNPKSNYFYWRSAINFVFNKHCLFATWWFKPKFCLKFDFII